ncbi:NADH dehydrogenase [ubiquinone] iron-sulfur protein 4, mitochondrial-like [Lineus longissimus]|uniref:NADH dehydrogenase [ubiquinone] iron-sulfur protein 4, mitochondrial-like n=1 Tax=Lineus longissimus TaxID=88925 RepID=UPI002B4E4E32
MATILSVAVRQGCRDICRGSTVRLISTSSVARVEDHSLTAGISLEKQEKKQLIEVDEKVELSAINGIPEEHVKTRRARIYVPARNAMQSGTFGTRKWRVALDTRERWENPLMGWTSTGDPMSNMHCEFRSQEDAVAFCEKNGWAYNIENKHMQKFKAKSYGANYSWNKRTRIGTK